MQVGEKNTEVDIQNWMSRTALELIGQAGLGYSFDPLTEEAKDSYAESIKDLMSITNLLCLVFS